MIHRLAVTAFAAAFFAACADTQTETPPAEPTPPEGVFGLAAPAVGGIPTVLTLAPLAVTQGEAGGVERQVIQFLIKALYFIRVDAPILLWVQ